jgi:hypothetical protein
MARNSMFLGRQQKAVDFGVEPRLEVKRNF